MLDFPRLFKSIIVCTQTWAVQGLHGGVNKLHIYIYVYMIWSQIDPSHSPLSLERASESDMAGQMHAPLANQYCAWSRHLSYGQNVSKQGEQGKVKICVNKCTVETFIFFQLSFCHLHCPCGSGCAFFCHCDCCCCFVVIMVVVCRGRRLLVLDLVRVI